MKRALLLIGHGTVDSVDNIPDFLANIRKGNPVSPELIAEVTRRYEAIGGKSPLNDICRDVAARLEARVQMPVRTALRLWKPYPAEVMMELAKLGATKIGVIPLAQHSSWVYAEAVDKAAGELRATHGIDLEVTTVPNWGREPLLTTAFARSIRKALDAIPAEERKVTTVIMTAHSLPVSIIEGGDPYADEVRASAEVVATEVGDALPSWTLAFQSQGMGVGPGGRPMKWLGPGLEETMDRIAAAGHKRVLIAPIGFLADHVEILYDLDIEAMKWAADRNLVLTRTASLNATDEFIGVLQRVAAPLLGLKLSDTLRNI